LKFHCRFFRSLDCRFGASGPGVSPFSIASGPDHRVEFAANLLPILHAIKTLDITRPHSCSGTELEDDRYAVRQRHILTQAGNGCGSVSRSTDP